MKLSQSIQSIFEPLDNNTSVLIEDKFTSYRIEYLTSKNLTLDIDTKIAGVLDKIPNNDDWQLSLSIDNFNSSVTLASSTKNYQSFNDELRKVLNDVEDEQITLKFEIKKNVNYTANIYDFSSFCDFVKGRTTIQFLDTIKDNILRKKLCFFIVGEDIENFYSQRIEFSSSEFNSFKDLPDKANQLREVCNFANYAEYPFLPTYFYLEQRPTSPNSITEKLDRLTVIFSIASIFDITSIKEKNIFEYKLNGFKTLQGNFKIDETNTSSIIEYMKIFDWIYSNSGNVADKINLSRNILSIYLKSEKPIEISNDVFFSIQSGFKTYLQQNLNRYIEIRNKISDQLIAITEKSNNIIENYLGDFKKSIITFISYFISVFLLKFLSSNKPGKLNKIFDDDTTNISLAFLAISFLYLLFSIWSLDQEIERLELRYKNLKGRFLDLLVQEDINRILNDDVEFRKEKEFIKKRRRVYSFLWIATLLILLMVILLCSERLSFLFP
ncbi:hypothetical protein [Pseudanabaena sp. PCC 6802]|uniref:hypothetical protein n=1 Tax=Pseudanabaena sp. PCC 6802 TaxID=118173 RepID=UPI00034B7C11|nr:hypothetical protein [Pseudanabaena sp. PCC 6802]